MKKVLLVTLTLCMLISLFTVNVANASDLVEIVNETFDYDITNVDEALADISETWEIVTPGEHKLGNENKTTIEDGALVMRSFSAIRALDVLDGAFNVSLSYQNAGNFAGAPAGTFMIVFNSPTDAVNSLYEQSIQTGTPPVGKSGIAVFSWQSYACVTVITYDENECKFNWQYLARDVNIGCNVKSSAQKFSFIYDGEGNLKICANGQCFADITLEEVKEVTTNIDEFNSFTKVTSTYTKDGDKTPTTVTIENCVVDTEGTFAIGKRPYNALNNDQIIDDIVIKAAVSEQKPTTPPTKEPAGDDPTDAPKGDATPDSNSDKNTDTQTVVKLNTAAIGIVVGGVVIVAIAAVVIVLILKKKK